MMAYRKEFCCSFALLFLLLAIPAFSIENGIISANSEPTYQALRHVKVANEPLQVTNLVLKRDVGTITLTSGTVCFLEPVSGMVTGAVFKGQGTFEMRVNDPLEARQVKTFTKGAAMKEEFETVTLRFSDGTADEIRKSPSVKAGGSCTPDPLEDMNHQLRTELHYNLTGRLLQPVLAGAPDGFFMAAVRGRHFSDRMYFLIDPMAMPEGLGNNAPEEVAMFTTNDHKWGVWYSSHLQTELAANTPRNHDVGFVTPSQYKIDATFAKNASLEATSTVTLTSRVDGLRVVPLDLYKSLRVERVTDASGAALHWIQESKDDDPGFYIILSKPLAKGEQIALTTNYSGKDAVSHEGSGNYYPLVMARATWYPNAKEWGYATYDLTLHVPKGNTTAATGSLVSTKNENGQSTTVWKSEVPIAVAGFSFGTFREEATKLDQIGMDVKAYANTELPDILKSVKSSSESMQAQRFGAQSAGNLDSAAVQSLSTAPYAKKALAEAQLSLRLFTDYFGPLPFKSVLVTQHTAFNYGQAWPGLVWLPLPYFMDSTQRHAFNWNESDPYFRVVEPHEVAHQWWGHTVGSNSYRDEWMSEGFSDFSASLFLQIVRNDRKEYLKFWQDQKRMLLEKNRYGVRPIDAGPLALGYRLDNSRDGNVTRELIYPKGAYVLQMLRMLMTDQAGGDQRFKAMMQDFAKSYANHAASTEDFKHITEKYMTPQMDVDRNHTMTWFFNEWVYGTEIPDYHIDSRFTKEGENVVMELTLKQGNVSENFKNVVPVYLELPDGRVARLGLMPIMGSTSVTQKVPLGPMKDMPRRALLNVNFDTLCTIDGN